jgi:hypothetical protein
MACKQQVTLCCILICPSRIRLFQAAVPSLIPPTVSATKSLGKINQNTALLMNAPSQYVKFQTQIFNNMWIGDLE